MPLEFELVSSEINPQFAQIADENDLVILTRFEVEGTSGTQGFLDLVYPYSSLKPVRELLRGRMQSGDGNEESEKQWRLDLQVAAESAEVQLKVLLGQLDVSLGDLQNMKDDDVLFFKKPDMARMMVNGLPAFDVQVGTLGTNVAVQIERSVIPDKE
jgi:flagellar motor switch protein FliM